MPVEKSYGNMKDKEEGGDHHRVNPEIFAGPSNHWATSFWDVYPY